MRPEVTGRKITTGVAGPLLPPSLDEHRVLSAKQAAELLGLSIATFRRQHWARKLPQAIRLSERRLGWRTKDLLAYIETRANAA